MMGHQSKLQISRYKIENNLFFGSFGWWFWERLVPSMLGKWGYENRSQWNVLLGFLGLN